MSKCNRIVNDKRGRLCRFILMWLWVVKVWNVESRWLLQSRFKRYDEVRLTLVT